MQSSMSPCLRGDEVIENGDVVVKDNRISEQNTKIDEQSGIITTQDTELHRAYFVAGEKSRLKEKGIIDDEGGFLWGLIGSRTGLAS